MFTPAYTYTEEDVYGALREAEREVDGPLTARRYEDWVMGRRDRPARRTCMRITKLSWQDLLDSYRLKVLQSPDVPSFPDKKESEVHWEEWFDHCEAHQKLHHKASFSQDRAVVNLCQERPKPCAVAFSSDWHLGSLSVDYRALREHIRYVLDTDNLYIGLTGDGTDNFLGSFNNTAAILQQIMPTQIQYQVFEQILSDLTDANKILWNTHDNHAVGREEKVLGWSPTAMLMARKVPYFGGKGTIELNVGKQKYYFVVTHDPKYRSILNPTHGPSQIHRLDNPFANLVATSHIHQPAIQLCYKHRMMEETTDGEFGGRTVFVVSGTFKTDDGYSKRNFSKSAPALLAAPTVVFRHDKKEMTPFFTAQEAVAYMKGIND